MEQAQGSCQRIEVLVHRFHWCTTELRKWLVETAKVCDVLCVVMGATQSSPSGREPLPLLTRQKIRDLCVQDLPVRVILLEMPDLLYQPLAWGALLQRKLDAVLGVVPQPAKWLAPTEVVQRLWRYWFHHPDEEVATPLRGPLAQLPKQILAAEQTFQQLYFEHDLKGTADGDAPKDVSLFHSICASQVLSEYMTFQTTALWAQCRDDYFAVKTFVDKWASAPYTPIFHTVDALVRCRIDALASEVSVTHNPSDKLEAAGCLTAGDYVLLIRRGRAPGKDLWAIPGGFLEADESRYCGALRELQEETGLNLQNPDLQVDSVGHWVVDAPRRSARGRILTTVYVFDLGVLQTLPAVLGADDAACAQWVTLDSVQAEACFEDHCFLLSQASLRFGWSMPS